MLNHVLKNRNNLLFTCQTAKSACSTKIKIMQIISEWPQFHSWLWSPQKNQLLDPLAIQVFWSIFLTWKCGRLIKETGNKSLFALFFQNLLINPLFHDICPYFLWCVSKENGAINKIFSYLCPINDRAYPVFKATHTRCALGKEIYRWLYSCLFCKHTNWNTGRPGDEWRNSTTAQCLPFSDRFEQ